MDSRREEGEVYDTGGQRRKGREGTGGEWTIGEEKERYMPREEAERERGDRWRMDNRRERGGAGCHQNYANFKT